MNNEQIIPTLNESIIYEGGGGGAVTSVNGKTGDVILDAEDVGALPDTTVVPTKTSELVNDSNFTTTTALNTAVNNHNTSPSAHLAIRQSVADVAQDVADLSEEVDGISEDVTTLEGKVTTIEGVIPSEASSSNKLADKAYVDAEIVDAKDYSVLTNKPSINSVTLTGNKDAGDLNLASLDANTFTQNQKINSAAYAGMKLQDGSDPTNVYTDFGKTGMYISDGDGVETLAYKSIATDTDINNLDTRITNLQNIGRFLAIWNATTGVPTSEPTVQPYNYRTGDYYRVGTAGTRIPTGSEYVIGGTNYVEGDECAIGDVFYYDGTNWKKQASGGGGTVQDVQVNGVSVLSGGIANVPVPTVTQSTGTSTTDVMSQNAATSMVYDNNSKSRVNIGNSNTTSASTPAVVIGTHCDALGGYTTAIQGSTSSWYSTAIGGYIPSGANYAVHIGGIKDSSYKVQSEYAVGLGSKSKVPTNASGSIALGAYSGDNITSAGMIDAGSSDTTTGYNSSNYRLLTGLYDPQNDHDAATKGYVDSHSGGGVQYTSQSGAPNDNDGNYGDLSESTGTYRDAVFIKTQWGPRKWQQIITNENPLDNGIRILDKATGNNFLVMESGASSNKGGVSLGVGANNPSQGTVDIGTTSTSFGYNNSQYRLLTGLYDGQSAHDAATVGQLNALIDAINSAANTNIPHIGS